MCNNSIILVDNMQREEIKDGATRLASLETDMQHIKDDVEEIKDGQKIQTEAVQKIEVVITKLATIVESNQELKPKVESLERAKADKSDLKVVVDRQNNIMKWMWTATGMVILGAFLVRHYPL